MHPVHVGVSTDLADDSDAPRRVTRASSADKIFVI